jgi:hypothetical protein
MFLCAKTARQKYEQIYRKFLREKSNAGNVEKNLLDP